MLDLFPLFSFINEPILSDLSNFRRLISGPIRKLEAEGFKTKLTEVKPKKPRVIKQVWFEQREGYGQLMRGTKIAYNVFPDAVYTAGGDSVTLASLPKKVQAVIKASAPQDWPLAHLLA